MSETNFHTFPRTDIDALAMLYLQNQDISNLSPEDLYEKYTDVKNAIEAKAKELYKNPFRTLN